jgi:hypothetical protein
MVRVVGTLFGSTPHFQGNTQILQRYRAVLPRAVDLPTGIWAYHSVLERTFGKQNPLASPWLASTGNAVGHIPPTPV